MPTLSTLIDKFLTRSTMTDTDKEDLRGDIGAVGTALEITTALQGAEADPTKIGEEYLPDILTPDYIRPGENSGGTASALPEGSLTRKGAILYYHDGVTSGGLQVGGVATGATNRASGVVISHPFGTTVGSVVSTVRQVAAGSYYVQELGRVKISGSKMVAGNRLCFSGRMRVKGSALATASNSHVLFVPLAVWNANTSQGTVTPVVPNVRIFDQVDAYEVSADFYSVTAPMSDSSGILGGINESSVSPYTRGVNHTTGAVYNVAVNAGSLNTSSAMAVGADAEFVVCFRTLPGETRVIWFDVSADAYTP